MSQEELADRVQLSVETISNIERGRPTTRLSTVAKIADALETPVGELFSGKSAVDNPTLRALVDLLVDRPPAVQEAVLDQAKVVVHLWQQRPV